MKLSKIYQGKERGGGRRRQEAACDCVYPAWPHFTFHTTFQLCKIGPTEPQSTVLAPLTPNALGAPSISDLPIGAKGL